MDSMSAADWAVRAIGFIAEAKRQMSQIPDWYLKDEVAYMESDLRETLRIFAGKYHRLVIAQRQALEKKCEIM